MMNIIYLLLHHGADPNVFAEENTTPLHDAIFDKHAPAQVVEMLLAKNADPTVRNIHLITPLHIAATWGLTDVVRLLLAKNSSYEYVNATERNGETALHFAAGNDKLMTYQQLYYISDRTVTSNDGVTAARLAFNEFGYDSVIIKWLLNGTPVKHKNKTVDYSQRLYEALGEGLGPKKLDFS